MGISVYKKRNERNDLSWIQQGHGSHLQTRKGNFTQDTNLPEPLNLTLPDFRTVRDKSLV